MSMLKDMIVKRNHKKCVKAFERINNELKYSAARTSILYFTTLKGYDELFEMISQRGWEYKIDHDNREGAFLTVINNKR